MDGGAQAGARQIRILGDNVLLADQWVFGNTFTPVQITADVRNVTELRVEISAPGADGVTALMVNAMLHPATVVATTPTPLITGATRTGGTAGFGLGGTANMNEVPQANAIWNNAGTNAWATYNLGGRWHTFTATIGRMDGGAQVGARQIRIYGDNVPLADQWVSGNTFAPVQITADVRNVTELRIEISAPGADGVTALMVNAILHPTAAVATTPAALVNVHRSGGSGTWGTPPGVTTTFVGSAQPFVNSLQALPGASASYTVHRLGGNFNFFEATIGHVAVTGHTPTENRSIRIYRRDQANGPDIYMRSYLVGPQTAPTPISVPVTGVMYLTVRVTEPGELGVTAALGTPRVR